jgi:hypothetical protein
LYFKTKATPDFDIFQVAHIKQRDNMRVVRDQFSLFLFSFTIKNTKTHNAPAQKTRRKKARIHIRRYPNFFLFKFSMFLRSRFVVFVFFNKVLRFSAVFFEGLVSPCLAGFTKRASIVFLDAHKRVSGDAFIYLRGVALIFFVDASFTDDEPL